MTMRDIKDIGVKEILIALLTLAIGALTVFHSQGMSNIVTSVNTVRSELKADMNTNFNQLWMKQDRITDLMLREREAVRHEQSVLKEELICIGKELESVKTRVDIEHKKK